MFQTDVCFLLLKKKKKQKKENSKRLAQCVGIAGKI